ncbi:hypothetical protein DSECCO2_173720 [anaerobic digester metagenome]
MRCQKFGYNIRSAVTAVFNGLPHLPRGIGHCGAVFKAVKTHTQGDGVDVESGSAKFVLRFAQAHGHAQQQFFSFKTAA